MRNHWTSLESGRRAHARVNLVEQTVATRAVLLAAAIGGGLALLVGGAPLIIVATLALVALLGQGVN